MHFDNHLDPVSRRIPEYPDRDTLSNVARSGYITARDQSMVESGVIAGGKNTASFLFREWTQQRKHEA